MAESSQDARTPPNDSYNRSLLLAGAKRNAVLQLWEVEQYGRDSFGDRDYVSIYGMRPADWYRRGVRLLGRTAVECTRDSLAARIAGSLTELVARSSLTTTLVVDPFAGSANTLCWLVRNLPRTRAIGFESDPGVFELTRRNISTLGLPLEIRQTDYVAGLGDLTASSDELLVVFLAPPWGDALSDTRGLDLARTSPPISEITDIILRGFPGPVLCGIQMYERTEAASLAEVQRRFDWCTATVFDLNTRGQNHGVFVGTSRWRP
jgi:hypothetical protein